MAANDEANEKLTVCGRQGSGGGIGVNLMRSRLFRARSTLLARHHQAAIGEGQGTAQLDTASVTS